MASAKATAVLATQLPRRRPRRWISCLPLAPLYLLKAHGTAVGLPTDDDMGNSEVGHNALGCGQIYSQGAKLVGESIENGSLFQSETWQDLTNNCLENGKALHFLGLLSDGNVHSNISHLIAMLKRPGSWAFADATAISCWMGAMSRATSALTYVDELEQTLASLRGEGFDYAIASGGGRMQITMDRYEANWPMVEQGWRTHVQGQGRMFASAQEAIETYRAETGCIDQDLPAFVVARDGQPVAKDRQWRQRYPLQLPRRPGTGDLPGFDRKDFDHFDRGDYTGAKICRDAPV